MSVDASRLEGAASCLHYMWSGPCIILFTLILLCNIIGWYALIGLVLLIAFIPIQNKIFSKMSKYRQLATKHSDERIKKMQEAIYGIRVIKFYCWEESILDNLVSIRRLELKAVTKIIFVKAFTSIITSAIPTFACICTFLTYAALNSNGLPSESIIPCLIFFNRLRMPLFLLPMLASFISDGKVSLKRIEDYMHAEELDFSPETNYLADSSVVIKNGNFDWNTQAQESSLPDDQASDSKESEKLEFVPSNPNFTGLHKLNLVLPKNKLIAVVGPIGSGKSSLLSALVGEMKADKNTKVTFCGSVGYSPQQAWIQNATIRENITFGKPFSAKVYHAVLKACALEKDLRLFPDGDQTEIGEKGTNLSGGQKQRINLARLAYSEADIVLMDDPLSAVDAHVGRHLFQNLIRGYLHNKTRILVTHQLHFLKQVDIILMMNNGRVEAMGSFSELNRKNAAFTRLMASLEDEAEVPESPMAEEVNTSPIIVNDSAAASSGTLPVFDDYEDTAKSAARLMAREERTYGSVSLSVFMEYVKFAGGWPIAAAVILAVASVQGSRLLSDWFATSYYKEGQAPTMDFGTFVIRYLCIGLTVALSGAAFSTMLSLAGLTAGGRLFREATFGVLRAPTSFFDTNPVGRIINRFSKDQDAIDNLLPESLRGVLSTFTNIALALAVVTFTSFYAIFLIIPSLAVYYYYQKMYRETSRELKRLDNLSKSPLVAQFSETLTGLTTIRAYGRQKMFVERNMHLLDSNNQAVFLQTSSERWAANRLEVFGAVFALTALLCSYISNIDGVLMGLAVGYALDISISLNWGIRQVADMESQIVSTERLSHYANNLPREGIDSERSELKTIKAESVPEVWPEKGAINFEGVTLSYRPDLPPVLSNICIDIKAGEKVGIVGRTGAGKSSVLMALFRIAELSEGRIVIDGVDIRTIPLKEARSPISIIPQDPVIFSGTVRSNLDPFGRYSDLQLWDALERAHLNHSVSGMEGKLDAEIAENGENLSVGQRQLLCLARALLRGNKILVLDEATANIDLETDALVQKCIRKDFANWVTILTIAHRLNTVIDYDRILVLDAGQVMEFDSPSNLLDNPNSYFSQLCAETGESNERALKLKLKSKASHQNKS